MTPRPDERPRPEGRLEQPYDQGGGHAQATRASVRLALWTVAWAATLALARYGPAHLWDFQLAASWAAVGLNLVVGIGWIVAYAHYLRAIDELQRRINLDALAVTLGVGVVGGFGYVVADAAGLIASAIDVALFPVLLGVAYIVSVIVGHLRYR